jgi:hypothetical protein
MLAYVISGRSNKDICMSMRRTLAMKLNEAMSIAICDVLLRHHFYSISTCKLHHEPKVLRMDFSCSETLALTGEVR